MGTGTSKHIKSGFFNGVCVGMLLLTLWLIYQYGFNFYFIKNDGSAFFRYCFRPVTMLTLLFTLLFIHNLLDRNIILSCTYLVLIWSYYDLLFLAGNFVDVYVWFMRDMTMLDVSLLTLFSYYYYIGDKSLNLKILFLSFLILTPFEFCILNGYSSVPEWYTVQYVNTGYTVRDLIFKLSPNLCFYISRKKKR